MFYIENPLSRFLNMSKNYGFENSLGRWYSNYLGKTENNVDPQQQGRVLVSVGNLGRVQGVPGVAATQKSLDLYAYPSSPYAGADHGIYFPPEKNDRLWVWFDHGSKTQPQVMGSLWGNTTPAISDDNQSSTNPSSVNKVQLKSPINSQVPFEFNSATNLTYENNNLKVKASIITTPLAPSPPTTRGIKSGGGHGILFEDDPTVLTGVTLYGRENRLELWTGSQPTPKVNKQPNVATPSVPAVKHHRLVMSDALQNISITSFGKQSTIYDDRIISPGIRTTSALGLSLNFDDKLKTITMSTPLIPGLPPLVPPLTQSITMNGITNSLSLTTPGTSSFITGLDAQYQSLGTMEVTSAGVLTISANGIIIQSKGTGVSNASFGGAVNNTFTGAVNSTFNGTVKENYNGGLTQSVTGTYSLTATQLSLVSAILQLGKNAAKFRLIDERFIAIFNAHSHLGPGLSPTIQILPADELLMLTSDVTAS